MAPEAAWTSGDCDAPHIPSIADSLDRAYFPHFEQLRRKLKKLDDFNLVPIEVPSRDVGRALVEYLRQHSLPVSLIEPHSWSTLAAQVLSLPTREQDAQPVMIFGPRDWVEQLPLALNLLNLQRDTIARHLQRPLLWCGLRFFLDAFWDHAPDFWSIRNVTTRIPLETEPHVPLTTILDPFARPMVRSAKPKIEKFARPQSFVYAALNYVRWLLVQGRAYDATKPLRDIERNLFSLKKARTTVEEASYHELEADVAYALEQDAAAENSYRVSLQGHRDTGDVHAETRVLAKLGRVAKRRQDEQAARSQFEAALQSAEALGDSSLRAAVLQARASDPGSTKQQGEALSDLNTAIVLFDSVQDHWSLARARVMRALLRFDAADYEGAAADLDQALPMLSFADDPIGWTNGHILRAKLYYREKSFAQAKRLLDTLRRQGGYAKQRTIRGWTLLESGRVLCSLGEYPAAEKMLGSALDLLISEKLAYMRADAYLERGYVRHELKKWTLAEHDALLAKGFAQSAYVSTTNHKVLPRPLYLFHGFHAHMLAHFEKFEQALGDAQEALEAAAHYPSQVRAQILQTRGRIRAQMGDGEAAWNDFDQGLAMLRDVAAASMEADMLLTRVGWTLAGNFDSDAWTDRMVADLEHIIKDLRPFVAKKTLAKTHLLLGQLHALREKFHEASRHVDEAVDLYESLRLHTELLAALQLRHQLNETSGDQDAVQTDLKRIVAVAKKHDDSNAQFSLVWAKALLAENAGDEEHALRILRQLREERTSTNVARAYADAWMARIQHRRGRLLRARQLAKRALLQPLDKMWIGLIEMLVEDIIS